MNKTEFSYEEFCKYVEMKMSAISKNDQGKYVIMSDTQPLQEFGLMAEDETLKHIYDNNLFEEMEKTILTSHIPHSYYDKIIRFFNEDGRKFESSNELRDMLAGKIQEKTYKLQLDDTMEITSKGDVVKTALSDATLVLEVKGKDALLFGNNQFVVANNFQQENGILSWGNGDYYSDLPRDPFRDIRYDNKETEKILMNIINNNYETLVKTLIRFEHYDTMHYSMGAKELDEVFDRFLENKEGLINGWFKEQLNEIELEKRNELEDSVHYTGDEHLEDEWDLEA